MSKIIKIKLSKYERELINDYGYPFEPVKEELEKHKSKKGIATIEVEEFWLEKLIADMSYSTRTVEDEELAFELDELTSKLEVELDVAQGKVIRVV